MKRLVSSLLMTCLALIGSSVFAGGNSGGGIRGGNSGGGGVFIELDVMAIRTFLYDNCDRFESFKKHNVSCTDFKNKIDEVGPIGKGISIKKKSLKLNSGKTVDARNQFPARIEFVEEKWDSVGNDVILKVGMAAHEFLSLMKLESTENYPISKDLVIELRTSGSFPEVRAERPTAMKWIREQLKDTGYGGAVQLDGTDSKSRRKCALWFTNQSSQDYSFEHYFVVVGFAGNATKIDDDYVGIGTKTTVGGINERVVDLHSDEPWGNATKFNTVRIHINLGGKPILATGKSDKRDIRCVLNP